MPATTRTRHRLAALPLIAGGLLTGALPAPAHAEERTPQEKIQSGLGIARAQLGDPYEYGAAGPDSFDCSGLVHYSFRQAGFSEIPRTSDAQADFATPIPREDMRPGDLMFFHDGGEVYHVAIYVGWQDGERLMIDAPQEGGRVQRIHPWSSSWYPGTLGR